MLALYRQSRTLLTAAALLLAPPLAIMAVPAQPAVAASLTTARRPAPWADGIWRPSVPPEWHEPFAKAGCDKGAG